MRPRSLAAPLGAEPSRLGPVDAVAVAALLGGLALYVYRFLELGARPEEDAAMLLRYSEHLARGHGIVWNQGEAPLDGATDFLFMVVVSLLHRAGLELGAAAQAIGLGSHALTVVAVYLGPRVLFGAAPALALPGAAFLAVGPGLRHLAASYGTPFFALWAILAFLLAARLVLAADDDLPRPALLFALACLGLGLARPEGVFLGGFILLSVLVGRRGDGARVVVGRYLGVFLTLGLGYFLWRWSYFGHPLPNPFYKKGGGVLHLHSLGKAWEDLWSLGLPFLLVLLGGLLTPRSRRWAVFTLIPVALFVALWVLISDETNYVMRFRYPILPLVLVGSVPVAIALGQGRSWAGRLRGATGWIACLLVIAGLLTWQHRRYRRFAPRPMGLHEAALVLREYAPRGFALVTTEAGLLPLFSGWRAVDAWGLNDAFVAHNGGITEEYLDRYRPEVIVFHAFFSPDTEQAGPRVENRSLGLPWHRMVTTLKDYAESRDYVLAAVYGRHPWDTHWYYVRRGFPQSEEIVSRLRALEYQWDGQPTTDYRAGSPSRAATGAARPNVVLVIVDTLRADALGSYDPGAKGVSPEIDALAARGVRLARVTAQSSWTRPSIGSLLTSRSPRALGLYRETFDVLPESATTLAETLRANGYETVGVTANPNINRVFGFEQGFDHYVDSLVVWPWMTPEPGQRTRSRRTALPDARTMLGDMLEHARAGAAAPERKPTYMQITLMDVHEGWRLVRPEFHRDDQGRVGVPKGYWDAVRQVSHDIGAFVEAVGELPGWGDTLFVITSDHGQGLDDHPDVERSWGHGLLLYGSQVDVPVIFYQPDRLAARTVETPVRLLDLGPTILDLVGVASPPGAEGRSLARLVTKGQDPALELPGYSVSETRYQGVDKIAVHTPAWSYIENRDGQEGLNPRELQPRGIHENGRLTDRIDEEPDVATELAALLAGWEARHPEAPATQPSEDVSPEELEQLEALGYIE